MSEVQLDKILPRLKWSHVEGTEPIDLDDINNEEQIALECGKIIAKLKQQSRLVVDDYWEARFSVDLADDSKTGNTVTLDGAMFEYEISEDDERPGSVLKHWSVTIPFTDNNYFILTGTFSCHDLPSIIDGSPESYVNYFNTRVTKFDGSTYQISSDSLNQEEALREISETIRTIAPILDEIRLSPPSSNELN